MKIIEIKTIYIFAVAAIAAAFTMPASASTIDGTIDPAYKYAWGENIGWINFSAGNSDVHITDSGLSGCALSETAGWINLDNVINDGEGNLSGYAWSENTGWINFAPFNGGVMINLSGQFIGSALGENIGWIIFDCSTSACVKTDWLGQNARPQCNNSIDDDNDGKTDYPDDPGCSSLIDNDETDLPLYFSNDGKIYKNLKNTSSSSGKVSYSKEPSPNDLISFKITPSFGEIEITIEVWNTSGDYYKKWKEDASSQSIISEHTAGDLKPSTPYQVFVDGELFGTYMSNSNGEISFTYDKGYSEKTFEVKEEEVLAETGKRISPVYYLLPLLFVFSGIFFHLRQKLSKP